MKATITDTNGKDRLKLNFDGENIADAEAAFELMKDALDFISVQPKVLSITIEIW